MTVHSSCSTRGAEVEPDGGQRGRDDERVERDHEGGDRGQAEDPAARAVCRWSWRGWTDAARANSPMSSGRRGRLTVHDHRGSAARGSSRRPGGRRARLPRAGRAVPARARGPLLPDARLRPRRRGRRRRRRCCAPGARSSASSGAPRSQTWLYRIATNACLDELERRPRRAEPVVDPYPGRAAARTPATPIADPAARYALREGMELAFLTAIQRLPGRQRAVLILRDVLGWTGAEVAELLDTTRRRGQQRAAARAGDDRGEAPARAVAPGRARPSASCCAATSTPGSAPTSTRCVALLREDAVLTMPPQPAVVGARGDRRVLRSTAASRTCSCRRRRPGSTAPRPSSSATRPETSTACSSSTSSATGSPTSAPSAFLKGDSPRLADV